MVICEGLGGKEVGRLSSLCGYLFMGVWVQGMVLEFQYLVYIFQIGEFSSEVVIFYVFYYYFDFELVVEVDAVDVVFCGVYILDQGEDELGFDQFWDAIQFFGGYFFEVLGIKEIVLG